MAYKQPGDHILGKYKVITRVDGGLSNCAVYLAEDPILGNVAIKELWSKQVGKHQLYREYEERFAQEAKITQQFQKNNSYIVQVFALGSERNK